nr:organic cation transporter protein-like [Ciona intestinalis]|eukprot:XP_026696705.1 organic cation transporter protein-like [Ciona intestinalis]
MSKEEFEELNVFGFYQKRLSLLLLLSTIPSCALTFRFLFTLYEPEFHCDVPSALSENYLNVTKSKYEYLLNSTVPWTTDDKQELVRSECSNYDVSDIDFLTNKSGTVWLVNRTLPCKQWRFAQDGVSALTEFKFVCERAWMKPFSFTIYAVGKMCGTFAIGPTSDKFGRRVVFLATLASQFLVALLMSFSPTASMYMSILFFTGATDVVYSAAFSLGIEFASTKKRTFITFCCQMGFSLGFLVLTFLGYFFRDWRWLLRVFSFSGLLYIPYYWLIDESPRWLKSIGREEESQRILSKIAKLNKTHKISSQDSNELETKLFDSPKNEKENGLKFFELLKLLVKQPVLLKRILVVFFAWYCTSLAYFVIGLNTNNLSENRFLNLCVLGLLDIAATAGYYLIAGKVGRRNSYVYMMLVIALLSAITPFVNQWSTVLVAVMVCVCKFAASLLFTVIYAHTNELFPTTLRQSIMGMSGVTARIGSLTAPYILFAGDPNKVKTISIAIGAVLLVSSALYRFLPKTINEPLPQTIDDAVAMGRSHVACFKLRRSKSSRDEEATMS